MDLSTTYLGLKLPSPLVVSASPLSRDVDGICRLEDAGASAVVLYSLFEEQLRQEEMDLQYHMAAGTRAPLNLSPTFRSQANLPTVPEGYLNHIRKAKASVGMPIIASLNGTTLGGWTKFAAEIERAGADAIECNIYFQARGIAADPMGVFENVRIRARPLRGFGQHIPILWREQCRRDVHLLQLCSGAEVSGPRRRSRG